MKNEDDTETACSGETRRASNVTKGLETTKLIRNNSNNMNSSNAIQHASGDQHDTSVTVAEVLRLCSLLTPEEQQKFDDRYTQQRLQVGRTGRAQNQLQERFESGTSEVIVSNEDAQRNDDGSVAYSHSTPSDLTDGSHVNSDRNFGSPARILLQTENGNNQDVTPTDNLQTAGEESDGDLQADNPHDSSNPYHQNDNADDDTASLLDAERNNVPATASTTNTASTASLTNVTGADQAQN
ncbi:expressed unknown protein [Seminavis robusta]|uniref:Uncharacterized protein n=1 Tax=Seminavis robusta TaxID=568900 RepID=A0A9N8DH99_9STRA|nr:expressed unknown protein [Seminavis robusta]|eukprot:Sro126_g060490.1 n/a (240) ;mRNA; f:21408-22424